MACETDRQIAYRNRQLMTAYSVLSNSVREIKLSVWVLYAWGHYWTTEDQLTRQYN